MANENFTTYTEVDENGKVSATASVVIMIKFIFKPIREVRITLIFGAVQYWILLTI